MSKDFSLLYSAHTGSEAHPTSYPIGTGVKQSDSEAGHSHASSAKVKNGGAIPPSPEMSSWHNVKDNFMNNKISKLIKMCGNSEMLYKHKTHQLRL
jgi:hypothetical protein